MIHIEIMRDDLVSAVKLAGEVTEGDVTASPASRGDIAIIASGTEVIVHGADVIQAVWARRAAAVHEPGAFVIQAARARDFLSAFTKNEAVTIKAEPTRGACKLSQGKLRFAPKIKEYTPSTLLQRPTGKEFDVAITKRDIAELVAAVSHAMSDAPESPNLRAIHFRSEDGSVRAAALNGRVLSVAHRPAEVRRPLDVLLPRQVVDVLAMVSSMGDGIVQIGIDASGRTHVQDGADFAFSCSGLTVPFPDWRVAVPSVDGDPRKWPSYSMQIDRVAILRTLKMASKVGDAVTMLPGKTAIFTSSHDDRGIMVDELPSEFEGSAGEIGAVSVWSKYFCQALDGLTSKIVEVCGKGGEQPIILRPYDAKNCGADGRSASDDLVIVMPIRTIEADAERLKKFTTTGSA